MRIGIPREIKDGEFRVALTPRGVAALRNVVVEPGAGLGVGFTDADYVAAGATLGDAWACDLVVKVKELQPPEYAKLRRGQTVFGFQHFAPEPEMLEAALASGATFIAYETVGQHEGRLPILAPMSAIAGRLADQGGIAETSRPTSHSEPIYIAEGVVHYCVPNMPAACARTASLALEQAVLPYVEMLARGEMNDELHTGVQVTTGKVVHAQLARDTRR